MKQIKTNCLHTGCAQDVWGLLRGMFLPLLLMMLMPAAAWADDELETIMVDGTSYYVLRNESDWLIFKELVQDAKGTKEVNAIMDTDFTVIYSIALDSSTPYCGTFNGNGHTLNLNINGGDIACIAPFSHVKNATFMNLHVTGTVSGGLHASGLIGSSDGTNYINNCWVSVTVNCASTHVGGFTGIQILQTLDGRHFSKTTEPSSQTLRFDALETLVEDHFRTGGSKRRFGCSWFPLRQLVDILRWIYSPHFRYGLLIVCVASGVASCSGIGEVERAVAFAPNHIRLLREVAGSALSVDTGIVFA